MQDEFEKRLHSMFDHIWECEIGHPVFQDTVGELMSAVIQCYNNLPSTQPSFPQRHENDHISEVSKKGDIIYREDAINAVRDNESENYITINNLIDKDVAVALLENLPPAQQETYKEKLNEIASALSEKFAYMNTCLNERDIILGYLGVKRPCETHCNTDCTNTKCESHPLSSAQPEPCDLCSNLEKGDTLYQSSDWDGGIGFDYIRDIQFCPKCGRRLE